MSNGLKILIVDDDSAFLSSMLWYLSKAGYKVLAASNGDIALSSVKTEGFDLIITDFKMSPVDGYELIRHLRSSDFKGKIILMSGSLMEEDIPEDLKVDLLIEKPFSLEDMDVKIKELSSENCISPALPGNNIQSLA